MAELIAVVLILVLGLGAYWTMVVYPRQRAFQRKQRYVRTLSKGDEIVTYGGIIGTLVDLDTEKGVAYVEIAEGIVVRLLTAAMQYTYDADKAARNSQIGIEQLMTEITHQQTINEMEG